MPPSDPAPDQKLHQIYGSDLQDLERILPELSDAMAAQLTPVLRTKFRRCQTILSKMRWGYGPPENVERIEANDEE